MEILDHCRDGLPIKLDESTREIVYKEFRIPYLAIKNAYESGMDKVRLSSEIQFRNYNGISEFGCLTLTNEKVEQLINTVWKLLKL